MSKYKVESVITNIETLKKEKLTMIKKIIITVQRKSSKCSKMGTSFYFISILFYVIDKICEYRVTLL